MIISILGCGWLGLPLAEKLRDNGHSIKGSTTSQDKMELLNGKDISPYLLKLTPHIECEDCRNFFDADLLVLNIPPGIRQGNSEKYHLQQIQSVIEMVEESSINRLIFVSSTSVYPETGDVVSEEDVKSGQASSASGEALIKAEKMLLKQDSFDAVVIRFGGLYGYDRHPVKYMAGRKNIPGGNAPVNLIHRDDCVRIIEQIIQKDIRNEIFNGVSDGHPPKSLYYPMIAGEMELEPPTFSDDETSNYKVVSNRKLKDILHYKFIHPNPMDI